MYWAVIFLGVSVLALPFATADASGGYSVAALVVAAVFAALSAGSFAFGRDGRAEPRRRHDPDAEASRARRHA